ncbi:MULTISPECIES: SDR family NAD(P)-dependent oxidoreductase [unclassified Ornithinimicrobium]|uniref:SDR family NAD(P)-dependent oxidoreductase n=1 Tax=unclassified Ornithinimicrobium TaxID=2615080 RepID=UPI003851AACD
MPRRSLVGAHVAVLGASGVLGGHVATVLHERGATVIGVGRRPERLRAVSGVTGSSVVGDLTDATLGERLVEVVQERHGRLDGVVNAAGAVAFGPLVDTPDEVIEHLFLTNVVGPLWLLRRVLPLLVDSRGFVAQISGVVAERPTAGMVAYSASKAALAAADLALGQELRRLGVDVVDLRVPHTETGLAGRAVAGRAPRLPQGLEPGVVARQVVDAVESRVTTVTAADFLAGTS